MDFEPCFKVYNLVSIRPKSMKLGQMTNLNVIFYMVQFIDWLQFETRPSSPLNFGMAYRCEPCCKGQMANAYKWLPSVIKHHRNLHDSHLSAELSLLHRVHSQKSHCNSRYVESISNAR